MRARTLHELKAEVDGLVVEGHGFREIQLWEEADAEGSGYIPFTYEFRIPEVFDKALAGDEVSVKKDILLTKESPEQGD